MRTKAISFSTNCHQSLSLWLDGVKRSVLRLCRTPLRTLLHFGGYTIMIAWFTAREDAPQAARLKWNLRGGYCEESQTWNT
jgi:hypothetical protein